ncbi:tetratricopeptide repeat protein [Methanothrix soehngenii]|uniref:tetratricopeptide repeat protein n=1 Tax=Methanothrix soehngenii TaxID=2223 RepID=UPI00300C07F4
MVTTLCEDVPSFHNQSWEVARILSEYVAQNKSKEWLRNRWLDLAKVTPSARFANDWVAERAHALLANGLQEHRKILERDYPKVKLVREVPLGFEVGAAADPQLFIREYGISDFILCVGRIESRKNQLMLLKAMEDSELPIVLAGGGFTYQPEYEQAVRSFRRKGKTLVVGRLTPQLLASAYAACRVHALPSWYELPGLVSLEAASFGKNVVVTETGTTPDYFGEYAFYAEASNWRSISNAVRAAYYSPVAPGLQAHVRGFTWDASIEKTLAVYQEVLAASGRRAASSLTKPQVAGTPSAPSWFTPGVVEPRPSAVTTPAATVSAPAVAAAPSHVPSSVPTSAAPTWGSSTPAPSASPAASPAFTQTAPVATAPQSPSFDSVLAQGEEAAKKGEFAEAHRLLGQAEQLNPSSARCLRARGAVFLAEQQRAEARSCFSRALALDPREARALVGLGMCSSFENKHAEGHEYFVKALEVDPEQTTALHQLLQASHVLGRFEALERALRRYLAKNTGDVEFQFCLAGCLYKQGNLSEAKTWCDRVLTSAPQHQGAGELRVVLARTPAQNQAPVAAVASATASSTTATPTTVATSSQIIPTEPSWLTASKANAVSMAIEVEPTPVASTQSSVPSSAAKTATSSSATLGYSMVERELDELEDKKRNQKFEEVAKACDDILRRPMLSATETERAELLRAETHTMFEEFESALERYERVLTRNPRCARAVCGKGAIAAHKNDWLKAEQLFQHALSISPEHDIACAGLGICAAQQRNNEKAWEWYQRATKANPENLRAIYGLIELSYPLKRLAELEEALRAYLELHPGNPQFVYSLAGCLYAQNKVPEAKAEVEKIIVFEPQNSKALELHGMIKKKLEGTSGAGWQH